MIPTLSRTVTVGWGSTIDTSSLTNQRGELPSHAVSRPLWPFPQSSFLRDFYLFFGPVPFLSALHRNAPLSLRCSGQDTLITSLQQEILLSHEPSEDQVLIPALAGTLSADAASAQTESTPNSAMSRAPQARASKSAPSSPMQRSSSRRQADPAAGSRPASPLVEGNQHLRHIDRAPPGDIVRRAREVRASANLARQKSKRNFFEDAFSVNPTSPARERVRGDAIVLAEVKTNVIVRPKA
ncbi:hypothetical protein VTG60DRAFT_5815 [Thermothelomyces hinnuleus]